MAAIDPTQLLSQMVDAFLGKLGQGAGAIRQEVEQNLSAVATESEAIAERLAKGEIDAARASRQLRVAGLTAEIALLSAIGIAEKALQDAINAALDVARQAVGIAL
ncbi:hypothetical protein SAMN06265365_103113 [Tistlia consotensis]|uniref:Uncharacterized protein n=1 Tax=Tistlia consotensis USBA 355 TaxID=560819 RepID=A0A1Y6BTL9_9PROT|nr:hypothetical protein [Tistlia consotensis]SMF17625.1 hypothetical protein SAMN05428998_106112 [Tistlia consotensis USBA 355]SNR40276.1 hypothetical protein SAMN06265365_103113 [Tistlia consotensis]